MTISICSARLQVEELSLNWIQFAFSDCPAALVLNCYKELVVNESLLLAWIRQQSA